MRGGGGNCIRKVRTTDHEVLRTRDLAHMRTQTQKHGPSRPELHKKTSQEKQPGLVHRARCKTR